MSTSAGCGRSSADSASWASRSSPSGEPATASTRFVTPPATANAQAAPLRLPKRSGPSATDQGVVLRSLLERIVNDAPKKGQADAGPNSRYQVGQHLVGQPHVEIDAGKQQHQREQQPAQPVHRAWLPSTDLSRRWRP